MLPTSLNFLYLLSEHEAVVRRTDWPDLGHTLSSRKVPESSSVFLTSFIPRAAVILKTADSKEALRNLLANAACEDLQDLNGEAKVNRMPGTQVLCCKLKIARRHKEFRQRFGKKDFNFIPETFSLLDEREDVLQSMTVRKRSLDTRSGEGGEDRKVWIVKPIGLSRGRGIFLTDNPIELPAKDNNGRGFLVQRYIADPYLIRGRKFDLRVYLLITGINPLKFYIYKDGFMR